MPSVGGTGNLFPACGNQTNPETDAVDSQGAGQAIAVTFLSILTTLNPETGAPPDLAAEQLSALAVALTETDVPTAGLLPASEKDSSADPLQSSLAVAITQCFVIPIQDAAPIASQATNSNIVSATTNRLPVPADAMSNPGEAVASQVIAAIPLSSPGNVLAVKSSAEPESIGLIVPAMPATDAMPRAAEALPTAPTVATPDLPDIEPERLTPTTFVVDSATEQGPGLTDERSLMVDTASKTADAPTESTDGPSDDSPDVAELPATALQPARSTEVPAKPSVDTTSRTLFVHQVTEHFEARLDQLRQDGRVEVHLNLHPPELGHMQMHLALEDNQLNVHMVVQDDAAKRALDQQLEPLRVHFAQIGVNLGQLDVRRDGDPQASHPESSIDFEEAVEGIRRAGRRRIPAEYAAAASGDGFVDIVA